MFASSEPAPQFSTLLSRKTMPRIGAVAVAPRAARPKPERLRIVKPSMTTWLELLTRMPSPALLARSMTAASALALTVMGALAVPLRETTKPT
jgi:hypothetical protein